MRDTFVKTLIELAQKDKNIELVTGDLGFGVLKPFWETVPDQFTDAGIAEQNMTTVAAGMALEGRPYLHIPSETFLHSGAWNRSGMTARIIRQM